MKTITHVDISVHSRGRKGDEFHSYQRNSGGNLYIDGRKVKMTKKGMEYWFHIVDGKIDHFWISKPISGAYATEVPLPEECEGCYLGS